MPTYVYEQVDKERERLAVERWMFAHGPELLDALGLTGGWWCGLCLDRRDIFSERLDGDVDLIAGPLQLSLRAAELRDRVMAALDNGHAQFAIPLAVAQAAEEGLVQWPPDVSLTVACEIKSSWFDGTTWKATHAGTKGPRRILGNLNGLRKRGVNKTSLLQLGATLPCTDWEQADALLDRALPIWPPIVDPDDLDGHGYYRALMSPNLDFSEALGGVHAGLDCLGPATMVHAGVGRGWHQQLRERLSSLPKPRHIRTYIHCCARCRRWRHAGSAAAAGYACECAKAH